MHLIPMLPAGDLSTDLRNRLLRGEGEDGSGQGGERDGHVEPVKEGALVREEQLGLHLRQTHNLDETSLGHSLDGQLRDSLTFCMAIRLWNVASDDHEHRRSQQPAYMISKPCGRSRHVSCEQPSTRIARGIWRTEARGGLFVLEVIPLLPTAGDGIGTPLRLWLGRRHLGERAGVLLGVPPEQVAHERRLGRPSGRGSGLPARVLGVVGQQLLVDAVGTGAL